MKGKIKQKKDGIICKSNMTDQYYLVTKWRDLGNGKIEAFDKKLIK